jgi:pimeloyl-ACP methyl ester carboxylesterase
VLTSFDAGAGRTLSYSRRGSGSLVVCLPGGPGFDPDAYYAPLDLPGHELLIFAPRGVGESTAPATPDGFRIAGYVEDVESLRAHLGVDGLTLYGHSHGGCVALAYAQRLLEHVNRLVISAAPPRMDDHYQAAKAEVRRRFAETVADGAARLAAAEQATAALRTDIDADEWCRQLQIMMAPYVVRQGDAEIAYLERLCAAPMNWAPVEPMYAEMFDRLDLLHDAGDVSAPTLVVAGEFDVVAPASSMRLLADALPNARYCEFAGVGHFPEVEASEAFSSTLVRFLAE